MMTQGKTRTWKVTVEGSASMSARVCDPSLAMGSTAGRRLARAAAGLLTGEETEAGRKPQTASDAAYWWCFGVVSMGVGGCWSS